MTESNAYLAYGITVTTESLLYAVAAWPRLQGPFAFLDLVALRKRTGTLVARHSSPARQGVQTVPVEVWDVVRHKLVDLELRAAEIEHLDSLLCDNCREAGFTADNLNWTELAEVCDGDEVADYNGLEDEMRQQAVEALVSTFGLALAVQHPLRPAAAADYSPFSRFRTPDSATMISLPGPSCATAAETFSISAGCGGYHCADGDEIVDVSFAVPPGAKQRFRRLVSTMHLQLVEVTDGFIATAGTRAGRSGKDVRREKRKFKKVSLEKLEPKWKLVTMAETQW
ncbi:hypothetical protein JCM8208_001224 [Rhodotorula glutinis]